MVIGIDFDGTCVTHEFPKIGKEIGATPILKRLVAKGHQLILFTMRSDMENPQSEDYNIHAVGGTYLTDAENWFKEHDIPLYGINKNPEQHTWTYSPKAYCQLYIDDTALGCPLIYDKNIHLPYVDWTSVEQILIHSKII